MRASWRFGILSDMKFALLTNIFFPYQTLLAKVLVVQMCVVVISRKCCMLSGVRDAITFMSVAEEGLSFHKRLR